MAAEPRREARAMFTDASRITLLEGDMDAHERELSAFKSEIRGEIKAMKNMMVGVIVSASTATIVGAINLVFKAL